MSGAMREKDAADFDLERFVDMFDQAMISDDLRVKNALRQLMMMVILTDTDDHEGRAKSKHGPLRRMQEDMREQFRWIQRLEQEIETLKKQLSYHEMQRQGGGYRAQNVGTSQSSTDYWNSVIAQKSSSAEIPASSLRGLNIKVATGDTDA